MEMDRQSLESVGDWSCIESDGQDVGKKRTGIVSVVGAGGKTTVIRRLREECLAEKYRILCLRQHICRPDRKNVL